jgi:hypothetical protein
VVARGRWVGAYRTPPDQGGIGIGQVVPRGRLNLVVRDLSIREVTFHDGLFLFLFSVAVRSCYLVFVSIPYNSHTDRRGHPEIRVVELFITEKQSNEVLNDDEERQKEGEYRSTNHKAYQSVLRKASKASVRN